MKTKTHSVAFALLISSLFAAPSSAQKPAKGGEAGAEEFFIISSVDLTRKQLVLKHPTEVTELVLLTDATTCLGEIGARVSCKTLRAGDTVFVVASRPARSTPTALRIRKGPMTVEEVHRKYMGTRS
jgi:hypothetical protein